MEHGDSRSGDRGAVIVETLLVLPILLMLLLGIVEFGRIWNAQIEVTHAAREAVRYYALTGELSTDTNGDGRTAESIASGAAPNLSLAVTAPLTCDPNALLTVGDPSSIQVSTTITFNIPFWQNGSFDLDGIGTMRCGG